MKLKRLQHVADTVCHMFCGWRLIFSKNRLVDLGSGELSINLLNGLTAHEGLWVHDLKITHELVTWMRSDLAAYSIPGSEISSAELRVDLQFSVVPWRDVGEQFYVRGKQIRTEEMHRCAMRCRSSIETVTGRAYDSAYVETEHWPVGWPKE